jgi:uncharacterized membrane protein
VQASGQTFSQTTAVAAVTTTVAAQAAVDWAPEVSSKDDDPGRTVPYVVEVQNRGNVDDVYNLAALGAAWPTTVWNESFTQPLGQTALLAPGEVQRIGVRVQIPSSAASPDLDAVLLRATSTYEAGLWDDALLVTRVNRPAPGTFGVMIAPSAQMEYAAPSSTASFSFTITNVGSQDDIFDLELLGNQWPLGYCEVSFSDPPTPIMIWPPGASTEGMCTIHVPGTANAGDWDKMTLLATSRGDPSVQDAVSVVIVVREGTAERYQIYLPIIFKNGP